MTSVLVLLRSYGVDLQVVSVAVTLLSPDGGQTEKDLKNLQNCKLIYFISLSAKRSIPYLLMAGNF
jgi:hypothetical protein